MYKNITTAGPTDRKEYGPEMIMRKIGYLFWTYGPINHEKELIASLVPNIVRKNQRRIPTHLQ